MKKKDKIKVGISVGDLNGIGIEIILKSFEDSRMLDFCKVCYVRDTPAEKFNSIKLEKIEERKEQVSHIVAICMSRDEVLPEWEEIAATAMAVQNMWLTCTAAQVGCYWSSPAMINYMNDFFDMR